MSLVLFFAIDTLLAKEKIMNTKDKGLLSETYLIYKLVQKGYTVSIPIGENSKYDI